MSASASASEHLILLGTHDDYVHSIIFDPTTKTLRQGKSTQTSRHPSWLTRHPVLKDVVYSNGHPAGKVFCNRLVDREGTLELLDEAESGGSGPTHLAVTPDLTGLIIANYNSGTTTHIPLDPKTGRFTAAKPVLAAHQGKYTPSSHPRQEAPHAHQIAVHGDDLLVPDLGSNSVWRLQLTGEGGSRGLKTVGSLEGFEAGDGPRHLSVHPSGTHAYVLCELSSTLTVHTLPSSGPSTLLHRFSILPPSALQDGKGMLAAEIELVPALRAGGPLLLICTNRDSPADVGDGIALFSVDPQDGAKVRRTERAFIEGVGKHVRALAPSTDGKWLCIAGRDAGGVRIFERVGADGLELRQVAQCDVEQVVVPLWM